MKKLIILLTMAVLAAGCEFVWFPMNSSYRRKRFPSAGRMPYRSYMTLPDTSWDTTTRTSSIAYMTTR